MDDKILNMEMNLVVEIHTTKTVDSGFALSVICQQYTVCTCILVLAQPNFLRKLRLSNN